MVFGGGPGFGGLALKLNPRGGTANSGPPGFGGRESCSSSTVIMWSFYCNFNDLNLFPHWGRNEWFEKSRNRLAHIMPSHIMRCMALYKRRLFISSRFSGPVVLTVFTVLRVLNVLCGAHGVCAKGDLQGQGMPMFHQGLPSTRAITGCHGMQRLPSSSI